MELRNAATYDVEVIIDTAIYTVKTIVNQKSITVVDLEANKYYDGTNFYFMSTKGSKVYSDAKFKDGDFLIFGKESHGLPEPLLEKHYDTTVRMPMKGNLRSLNLSNTVAIAVYEALRQQDFAGLNTEGELTGRGF